MMHIEGSAAGRWSITDLLMDDDDGGDGGNGGDNDDDDDDDDDEDDDDEYGDDNDDVEGGGGGGGGGGESDLILEWKEVTVGKGVGSQPGNCTPLTLVNSKAASERGQVKLVELDHSNNAALVGVGRRGSDGSSTAMKKTNSNSGDNAEAHIVIFDDSVIVKK